MSGQTGRDEAGNRKRAAERGKRELPVHHVHHRNPGLENYGLPVLADLNGDGKLDLA